LDSFWRGFFLRETLCPLWFKLFSITEDTEITKITEEFKTDG